MLTVRVYSQGVHVGDADLEATDPPMGGAGGPFRPLAPYAAIQRVVREFGIAMKPGSGTTNRTALARFHALDWALMTEAGVVLEGTGGIDLYDFEELGDGSIELHIFGVSKPEGAYLRYFSNDPAYREYYKKT